MAPTATAMPKLQAVCDDFAGGRLDSIVKNKLFQAYCSSHYGSELWHLSCSTLSEYCSAWRRGLRRIWELPNTFRSDYLSAISCTGLIYDVLCQRFLNFIATCHSSDSELIRFVIKHAVYYAQARRLSVVIMHCVIRDTGLRSKMNLSLVLNLRAVIMRL